MTSPETLILEIDENGAQPLPEAPQGGTVLLLHSAGGREGGWAGRAALALARGWRDEGQRVFLCDATLESPQLHKSAGVSNGEGISDALRFGTSFKRVAHRLDSNLFLATAGTVAVDAAALRESPRWDTFTAGFAEAGALLLLFAPVDGASVDALVRRADLVYVLASPGEAVSADHLGGEPSLILMRADRQDPAALLDAEDAGLADSLDWDEPAGESEDAGSPADNADSPADDGSSVAGDPEPSDGESLIRLASEESTLSPWTPTDLDDPDEDQDDAGTESEEGGSGEGGEPAIDLGDEAVEVVEADAEVEAELDDGNFVDPLGAPRQTRENVPAWERPAFDDVVAPEEPESLEVEFEDPLQFLDPLIGDAADPAPEVPAAFAALPADADADDEDRDPAAGDVATASKARVDGPVVAPKRAAEKSSRSRTVLLMILLVVIALAAAVWFGLIEIPGLPQADASESTSAVGADGVASAQVGSDPIPGPGETPVPQAGVAAWVLALGSFSDIDVALQQVEDWSQRTTELQFVLAPVEVDGQAWYRLLAGPASDSAGALSLGQTLAAESDGVDPSGWLAREARLAFLLGETRGRAAAEQRVSVLRSLGIPAHILRVPYSDNTEVFRVYAGAYASASEAAYLERLLQDQDITNAPLTERLGTLSE